MGGLFNTPPTRPIMRSKRQLSYLNNRKTDRPRNNKTEESIQIEASKWLRENLPDVHFRSDTGSGAFNSKYAKNTHNLQQSSDAEPDMAILAARRGFHGWMVEFKADGVKLKKSRDGTKILVTKDRFGRIISRDHKIRMKGDWSTLHIEKQAHILEDYRRQGYYSCFAVGLEDFKRHARWYFDLPAEPEATTMF